MKTTTSVPSSVDMTPITNLIGAESTQCPDKDRIDPGHPERSYLVDKILGMSQEAAGCFEGLRMPRTGPPLSAAEIATIQGWIASLPTQ